MVLKMRCLSGVHVQARSLPQEADVLVPRLSTGGAKINKNERSSEQL